MHLSTGIYRVGHINSVALSLLSLHIPGCADCRAVVGEKGRSVGNVKLQNIIFCYHERRWAHSCN